MSAQPISRKGPITKPLTLSPEEHDELGRAVLNAIEDERSRDELLEQPQDLVAEMADEAEAE